MKSDSTQRCLRGMQAAPKSCGHVRGKKVVSRGEAVARIRAAVDARDESGSNIVIVARSDAYQAESFDVRLPALHFQASGFVKSFLHECHVDWWA